MLFTFQANSRSQPTTQLRGVNSIEMHLWSPKRTSSTTMLSMAERYKQAYDCIRDELRRVKVLHAKQLADKDAMIQDLNEQIHRLQQQQQHNPTRTLSKSSSSSLSISNKPARRNSFSVSTNSTSSLMKMAELASFSSSFSNSVDDEESVTSHNGGVIHESFLSMPTEPLREADEEAEEEEKEEQQQRQAKDIPSQPKKGETVRFKAGHNRPDEDDEEVASDKLPRRNHSLSIFVKRASKRFVRRISSKQKSARPFFRRQVRRKGTQVPTTMQIMADLKEKKVEGNNQDEDDPRDIHFNPDPDNEDEESRDKVPRLDSLQRKASIYSRSSSGWSIDAMPSDSPHRLQAAKSSSDWSTDPLPSDSAVGSTKPRRATIASTTVRVRALPRELSLDRVVSEEDSDDDDDWLSPPQSPTKSKNGHNESIHVVEVHCQHIVDACNRRGVYSGSLDLKTQLPHGPGRQVVVSISKMIASNRCFIVSASFFHFVI